MFSQPLQKLEGISQHKVNGEAKIIHGMGKKNKMRGNTEKKRRSRG